MKTATVQKITDHRCTASTFPITWHKKVFQVNVRYELVRILFAFYYIVNNAYKNIHTEFPRALAKDSHKNWTIRFVFHTLIAFITKKSQLSIYNLTRTTSSLSHCWKKFVLIEYTVSIKSTVQKSYLRIIENSHYKFYQ